MDSRFRGNDGEWDGGSGQTIDHDRGHSTSISLEPVFWDALKAAAEAEGIPLSALVARIDADRIETPAPPNLASTIRVWLFERARD